MLKQFLSLPIRKNHARFNPPLLNKILFFRWPVKVLVFFLGLASSFFGLLVPLFQKEFIDSLLGHPLILRFIIDGWPAFYFILGAFLFTVLAALFNVLMYFIAARESVVMQRYLGEGIYQKALELRPDAKERRPIGETVSIFATDVAGACILIEQSLPSVATIIFPLILAPLALVYLYSPPLWPTMTAVIGVFVINILLAFRQAGFFQKFKQMAAERSTIVNEWVQNIRALKILGWTDFFESRIFKKRIKETENRVEMVTNGQIMSSVGSSITFVVNIAAISSFVLLSPEKLTPGSLLSVLWIVGVFLSKPFRHLPWVITYVLDGVTSIHRLEKYLNIENSRPVTFVISQPEKEIDLNASLAIEIRNLNLQAQTGQALLSDISFDIKNNEFVCIVGEVGSGKSLLLLSLLGETGATNGGYKLFGSCVNELSMRNVKRHFAFVPQESFVMSARLKDNVALGFELASPTEEEVATSLALSQFDIRSEGLTFGSDTEIGERGVNLSGGQRQRLNLARAHYFDRPIVLMDDCLSAIDVNVEKQIIRSLLLGSWKDKTRILVTHRLAILAQADRILFMEDGRVIESGTFDSLVKDSDRFRAFIHTTQEKPPTPVADAPAGA